MEAGAFGQCEGGKRRKERLRKERRRVGADTKPSVSPIPQEGDPAQGFLSAHVFPILLHNVGVASCAESALHGFVPPLLCGE